MPQIHLVDLLRRDPGFDAERIVVGHDQHDRLAVLDHAAHRVDAALEDLAVLRRHEIDPLQLVLGRTAAARLREALAADKS